MRKSLATTITVGAGLFALLISSATVAATTQTNDYQLDENRVVSLQPLLERNLNTDEFSNDAYDYNHNIFMIGDDIYFFVQSYKSSKERPPVLRRINLADPETVHQVTINYSTEAASAYINNTRYKTTMLPDEAGNICLVAFSSDINRSGTPTLGLIVWAYKPDPSSPDNLSSPIESSYIISSPEDKVKTEIFHNFVEIKSIKGDACGNQFTVELNGLHRYCDAYATNEKNIYVTKVLLKFTNHKISTNCEYIQYAAASTGDEFSFNISNNVTNDFTFLNIEEVNESVHIAQGLNTTAPLLFQNNGNTSESLITDPIPLLLDQVDALEELAPNGATDGRHYGAYPISLDGETFLLTNLRTYDYNGPKFGLSHWSGDLTTFDGLQEIMQFPEDAAHASLPKIYPGYARPKVAIAYPTAPNAAHGNRADDAANGVRIATYVPSMGLGVYNLSVTQQGGTLSVTQQGGTPSGLQPVVASAVSSPKISIEERRLKILWNGRQPANINGAIIAADGSILATLSQSAVATVVDLSALPAGIYMVRINDSVTKFRLR